MSKAHGGAVRRNNIKRRLREAFRLERAALPGSYDLILIPKVLEGHWSVVDLRTELQRLVTKVHTQPADGPRGSRSRRRRPRPKSQPNPKAPKDAR